MNEAATMRPILIQGAHPPEVDKLVRLFLPGCEEHCIDGFKFWDGMMQLNHVACRVVVSITGIGLALASASVVIAKQHFNPIAIINQGIAGGHTRDVQVGDIIVGEYCVNLNSFKTPFASQGAGSNSLTWKPKKSRGSGGGHEPIGDTEDMSYIDRKKIKADAGLLTACKSIDSTCRVIFGGIGTSETWNSEVDRIDYLHALFGTLCEGKSLVNTQRVIHFKCGYNHRNGSHRCGSNCRNI